MPYQEIDHTADWALRVWAASLEALFTDAALGMYALMGAESSNADLVQYTITVQGMDAEAVLVVWLQELLYYTEAENVVFERFNVLELKVTELRAEAWGRPVAHLLKIIKAVTYHNLVIQQTETGYETTLVFDV